MFFAPQTALVHEVLLNIVNIVKNMYFMSNPIPVAPKEDKFKTIICATGTIDLLVGIVHIDE